MGLAPTEAAAPTTLMEAISAIAPLDTQDSTVRKRLTTAPPVPAPTVRDAATRGVYVLLQSSALQMSARLYRDSTNVKKEKAHKFYYCGVFIE